MTADYLLLPFLVSFPVSVSETEPPLENWKLKIVTPKITTPTMTKIIVVPIIISFSAHNVPLFNFQVK